MLTSPMTLQDPLSTVLHQLGNKLLSDAQTQAESLETENTEALHDFRVSVRRLRSFLKSYEDVFDDTKKHRERFADIMTLTDGKRNSDVRRSWLQTRQKKASEVEQAGLDYLLEHVNSDEVLNVEKVKEQFASAAKKLEKTFSKDLKEKASFGKVTAKILKRYSGHLEKRLSKIENSEDDKALQRTRSASKNLRYTLELLDTQESKALVKDLVNFQTITGELRELQWLESKVHTLLPAEVKVWSQTFKNNAKTLSHEELKDLPALQNAYGLAAVQQRLEAEETALANELQEKWLNDGAKEFFQKLTALVEELTKPAETPNEEVKEAAPKKAKKRVAKNKKKRKSVVEAANTTSASVQAAA